MVRTIGVLGGAFDPIHHGHLRLAWEMIETLKLDAIHLIPTHQPPHRSSAQATMHHRLAMLQCASQLNSKLIVDDREAHMKGPSYTVNTLISLRKDLEDKTALVLIMGMDAFNGLCTWHEWEHLLDLAHIAISQRPGAELTEPKLQALVKTHGVTDPAHLHDKSAGLIYVAPAYCPLDIDATRIRAGMQQGRLPKYLVPDEVLDYIIQHHLYRGAHANTDIE